MKKTEKLGSLSEVFEMFLNEKNIIISACLSDVESVNNRTLFNEKLQLVKDEFNAYLQELNIILNFENKNSKGNYSFKETSLFVIEDVFMTIDAIIKMSSESTYVEASSLSPGIRGFDDFERLRTGELIDRVKLNSKCFENRVNYRLTISEKSIDSLGNITLGHPINVIASGREFSCLIEISDNIYYLSNLENTALELQNDIKHHEKDIQKIKLQLESYNWLIEYMTVNKIKKESKSLMKSKMVIEQMEKFSDKEEALTNITEILELTV